MLPPAQHSVVTQPEAERRLRVLHVIDSLGVSGGSERQLMNNLIRFSDPAIEHRVAYLFDYPLDVRVQQIPDFIPVDCLFRPGEGRRDPLRAALRIRGVVRAWHPDIVHCSLAQASLASRLAGIMCRTPVIESLVNIGYTPERLIDNSTVSRPKLAVFRLAETVTMRYVSLFHAVSQTVADSWVQTAGIAVKKIRVIPRGVDPAELETAAMTGPSRQELLESLGIPPHAFVLLAVGRQEPQKGHRYLLEAISQISEADRPMVVLFAGRNGTLTETLRVKAGQLAIESRVFWLGHRDDVPALLRAADVFVFPSLYEGMPGSLLEAMAMGRACVASEIGSVREVITDGVDGLLVPPRDPTALAAAISALSRDSVRREALGVAASDRVRSAFSADVAAAGLEALYRETCS